MDDHAEATTFRSIAKEQGITLADPLPRVWPLEQWFASVVDTPLAEFSHFDLARACRQRMFHERVVPFALEVVLRDPLAGDSYDGEMLVALVGLPAAYWDEHERERGVLMSAVEQAYGLTDDPRLQAEIEAFRAART